MAIQGLSSLNRKLRTLPLAAEAALKPIMEDIATNVVRQARSLAPVESGALRESINWVWGDAPEDTKMILGTVRGKASKRGNFKITIFAGNDEAFYARWIEFGTAPHIQGGIFAGTQHPGTPAHPYFYPSWRANRKSAKGKITRALTKSARRVAAGGK